MGDSTNTTEIVPAYIATVLSQLAAEAERAGERVLAALLRVAAAEAKRVAGPRNAADRGDSPSG